jgi:hypothetical protein
MQKQQRPLYESGHSRKDYDEIVKYKSRNYGNEECS